VQKCLVVLDTMADDYDEDGFERAVTAAASIVAGAAPNGISTRLVAPGMDLRGPDVAHESLRWLATVEPSGQLVDHLAGGRTSTDGLGLLAIVTSSVDSRAARSVRALAGPDETVVVVATMLAPSSGNRFAVNGTSLEALQLGWNQLVLGTGMVL